MKISERLLNNVDAEDLLTILKQAVDFRVEAGYDDIVSLDLNQAEDNIVMGLQTETGFVHEVTLWERDTEDVDWDC